MARKNDDRANLGEQVNNRGMEADRAERTGSSSMEGDAAAGDEGIDEVTSRTQRDDMSVTPRQGDELKRSGRQSSQSQKSQRSHRTNQRSNDEASDTAGGFSGQGSQMEGTDESAQGTGYTRERSESDESSRR
jgi:hypothetical protein